MKTKSINRILVLMVAVSFIAACRKDFNFTPTAVPPPPPPPPGMEVKFSTDIWPSLSSCIDASCHGGSIPPDLSNASTAYTSLMTGSNVSSQTVGKYIDTTDVNKSVFYIRISTESPDPQMGKPGDSYGTLTTDQIAKIKQWIELGAKQ